MQLIHILVDRIGDIAVFNLVEGMPAQRTHLRSRCDTDLVLEFLHEAERLSKLSNSHSTAHPNLVRDLRDLGEAFYRQLIPEELQAYLRTMGNTAIFFHVDDAMRMIPWEILHDGSGFLLDRFHIGVNINGRWMPVHRPSKEKLRVLIVADPSENLDWARHEGEQLYESLLAEVSPDRIDLQFLAGRRATKLRLLGAIQERDIVHFAGHAVYDPVQPEESGWLLFEEKILRVRELRKVSRAPLLVFANSCLSAPLVVQSQGTPSEVEQQSDLASAFLHAGIGNYIGTHWEIRDNLSSAQFALSFYRSLFEEHSVGEALTKARQEARRSASSSDLGWASYVLYGNPLLRVYHAEKRQSFDASRLPGHIEQILHSYPLPIAKVYSDYLRKEKSAEASERELLLALGNVLEAALRTGGAVVLANPALQEAEQRPKIAIAKDASLSVWTRQIFESLAAMRRLERKLTVPRIQSAFETHESAIEKMLTWKRKASSLPDSSEELSSYLIGMQFHLDNFLRDLFGAAQSLLLVPSIQDDKKFVTLLNGESSRKFSEDGISFLSAHARRLLFEYIDELCYYHKEQDVLYSLQDFLEVDPSWS